jgi:hypothetical protein
MLAKRISLKYLNRAYKRFGEIDDMGLRVISVLNENGIVIAFMFRRMHAASVQQSVNDAKAC